VELAYSFAKIARKDLHASKALYEKGLYPQAIFYLQQSVEKAVKAVGLLLSLVHPTKRDLTRNVRHASIYAIILRRSERIAEIRRILDILMGSEGLEEAREVFSKLGIPWTLPDPAQMKAQLADDSATLADVEKLRRLSPRDMWKATLELDPRGPMYASLTKLLGEAEKQWKTLDWFQKIFEAKFAHLMQDPETVRYALNIHGRAFPEVAPLAFLTMWHERETRYPAVDPSDYWDPTKYTRSSGIVQMYPRLYHHTRRLCGGAVAGAEAALRIP